MTDGDRGVRTATAFAIAGMLALVAVLLGGHTAPAAAQGPVPAVFPTPVLAEPWSADAAIPSRATIVADEGVDAPTRDLVRGVLSRGGASEIAETSPPAGPDGGLVVRVGTLATPDIAAAVQQAWPEAPALKPEGYVLLVDGSASRVVLAGADRDGAYYAAQTLRQLLVGEEGAGFLAGVRIADYPAMPLRGSIEGFYGSPWSHQERMDQLAFYGDMKMNTYVYAPKDDPYHRAQWRDPYPPADLNRLHELVDQATAHHVRFTFALSPGVSICYTDQADYQALIAKLQAMYDVGVRAFSIPLDDISTSSWGCPLDYVTYGLPNQTNHAHAQVELLNRVQREFVETHPGAKPLQTVPTQYSGTGDSTYKQYWRANLDNDVVVMWTGVDVVPPEVTNAQASLASERYGRDVFLWDNYPVNDYGQTEGRLLLAPYDKREAGLSENLVGIVANPMNQAGASKVALFTIADFTWNDGAYDRDASWRGAADYLSSSDPATSDALLTFFDLEHLAPTFGATPWQTQAPGLASWINTFWSRWNAGVRRGALADAAVRAMDVEQAPAAIRAGVADPLFLSDATPWLDATELWGRAFAAHVEGLRAAVCGDPALAEQRRVEGRALMTQARAITAPAGENRWTNTHVRVGDGVLDKFLDDLDARIRAGIPDPEPCVRTQLTASVPKGSDVKRQGAVMKAVLTTLDPAGPVPGTNVKFLVKGVLWRESPTDGDGVATAPVPSGLKDGTPIRVEFGGTQTYRAVSVEFAYHPKTGSSGTAQSEE